MHMVLNPTDRHHHTIEILNDSDDVGIKLRLNRRGDRTPAVLRAENQMKMEPMVCVRHARAFDRTDVDVWAFVSPLRGLHPFPYLFPTADAVGSNVSPLRGCCLIRWQHAGGWAAPCYSLTRRSSNFCFSGWRSWAICFSFSSTSGSNIGISTALFPCSCLRKRNR